MNWKLVAAGAAVGVVAFATPAEAFEWKDLTDPDTGEPLACTGSYVAVDEGDPVNASEIHCTFDWASLAIRAKNPRGSTTERFNDTTGNTFYVSDLSCGQDGVWQMVFLARDGDRSNGRVDGRAVISC